VITLVCLLCIVVDIQDCFVIGGVPMYICVFFSLFGCGFIVRFYVSLYLYSYPVSCFVYFIVFCVWVFVLLVL